MTGSTIPPPADVLFRDSLTPGGLTMRVASPTGSVVPATSPVLLVHGLAGGAWYWDRYQRVLAEHGFTSHALNLRGHHDSRGVADLGRVSLTDYVADVSEAAACLGRPVVVGHSLGGLLAQAVAAAGGVSAAVLLTSMPPRGIRFASPGLVFRQLRHLGAMLLDRPLRGTPGDIIATTLNRIPGAEQQALAARFVPDSGRVARELSLGGLAIDPAHVQVPVLVISATEDRFFSPRVGTRVAARYGAEHRIYEGHAHFIVREPGGEVVAADIARWIRSNCCADHASEDRSDPADARSTDGDRSKRRPAPG